MRKVIGVILANVDSQSLKSTIMISVFLLFAFSEIIYASNNDIDPAILKKFKLVEEEGKTVVEASMENLLKLALERSSSMDILAINEQIARENLSAVREAYNPVLITSVGIQHQTTLAGTNLSGSATSALAMPSHLTFAASDITSVSASWNKRTQTGISYGLTYGQATSQSGTGTISSEGDSFGGWSKTDDSLFIDSLTASVKVPIFQDWGDVNKLPEYRSETAMEETGIQSRKSKLELLQIVANVYWDLVGVDKTVEALQASVRLAEQFLQDTRTRQELGILDPIEVKQSESRLALIRQNLLQEIVRKRQIEDQIRVFLNLEDLPYGYRPTESMRIRKDLADFEILLEEVFGNNQDLGLLNIALKMNSLTLKEAENRNKIDLDFNIQYQLNGYGKGLSESMAGMSETNLHDYQLGVTWNIPLFDKITPQKIKQANLERSRLNLQIDSRKSQLKIELQSILRNLKLAEQGIRLARTSVELVEDLLHKEAEKFKVGNNTSYRIAQVQQDLIDAQKSEILAKVLYEKTYLVLLILTEKILPEYNLDI